MTATHPACRLPLAATAAGLLLALPACAPAPVAAGPASTGATPAAATPYVSPVRVGDCLDVGGLLSAAADEDSLVTARCDEPHDGEVYAETELAEGARPGDLEERALEFCAAEFEEFVGVPHEESSLEVTYVHPSEESWDRGDRSLRCVAVVLDGTVDTSFAGTGT